MIAAEDGGWDENCGAVLLIGAEVLLIQAEVLLIPPPVYRRLPLHTNSAVLNPSPVRKLPHSAPQPQKSRPSISEGGSSRHMQL